MKASDLRRQAWQTLKGHWPTAVLAGLVASLLCGIRENISLNAELRRGSELTAYLPPDLVVPVMTALQILAGAALLYGLVMTVLGSVIRLGYARYNLNLADGKPAGLADLFGYFHRFRDALVLRLLICVYVFLWSLLFLFPGIMASYSYSVAPYIMAEDPSCTPREAIRRSRDLMDGYRVELLVLRFSFIGWTLLSALTLGLGALVLVPYSQAAEAVFYRQLQNRPHQEYLFCDSYEEIPQPWEEREENEISQDENGHIKESEGTI